MNTSQMSTIRTPSIADEHIRDKHDKNASITDEHITDKHDKNAVNRRWTHHRWEQSERLQSQMNTSQISMIRTPSIADEHITDKHDKNAVNRNQHVWNHPCFHPCSHHICSKHQNLGPNLRSSHRISTPIGQPYWVDERKFFFSYKNNIFFWQ